MSKRPLTVDEILETTKNVENLKQPIFLSKNQRIILSKLKEEKKKRISQDQVEKTAIFKEVNKDKYIQENKSNLKNKNQNIGQRKNKFKFDWDQNENTLIKKEYDSELSDSFEEQDEILIEKNWREKTLNEMTERDWRIFRKDFEIVYKCENYSKPLRSWDESDLKINLINTIKHKLHLINPTPIQRAAIPSALDFKDILGIAKTGSGKTLAFVLPLISYIMSIDLKIFDQNMESIYTSGNILGLIVVPTRELAIQIYEKTSAIAFEFFINVFCLIGGHDYNDFLFSEKKKTHIVIATPGRLIEFLEKKLITLNYCFYFILDEADKMIDMGFEPSIKKIINYLPNQDMLNEFQLISNSTINKIVTLMFSATFTPEIKELANFYLKSPVYVNIGEINDSNDFINQDFEFLESSEFVTKKDFQIKRFEKMLKVINNHINDTKNYLIIIFVNFKKVADLVSQNLNKQKLLENSVIHGSKSQNSREKTMKKFYNRELKILVATDIAARGIDIPNVTLVINYHMPNTINDYIHRIGRTGRAGCTGSCFSFVDESDAQIFPDLKKFLEKNKIKCQNWISKYDHSEKSIE